MTDNEAALRRLKNVPDGCPVRRLLFSLKAVSVDADRKHTVNQGAGRKTRVWSRFAWMMYQSQCLVCPHSSRSRTAWATASSGGALSEEADGGGF